MGFRVACWPNSTLTIQGRSIMAKRADLEPEIITLWRQHFPAGERKSLNVIDFYGWLSLNRADLLAFNAPGDKYQAVKAILYRHIEH